MLDQTIRTYLDPLIEKSGRILISKIALQPLHVTFLGFFLGVCSLPYLFFQDYKTALFFIILGRICDGFDGTIARLTKTESDRGGYFDIVCDFIIYAAVPFFFALGIGHQTVLMIGCFVLFSIMVTGTSFLTFAIFSAKNKLETSEQKQRKKSLYFLGGLIEGTETFAFMTLICLFPLYFIEIGFVFGVLCLITGLTRMISAYKILPHSLNRIDD